jgi:type VI secretion system protein ImpA
MIPVVARLMESISADNPCGADIEDTPLLASFDAYRLFGQMTAPSSDTDWREIRDRSIEALEQSHDLRLLAHLAAASLRTDGLAGFCDVLQVASRWFTDHPDQLFPRVDEDAILRKNALNAFADRMAIVDAVRRQPFVSNPQLGAFALRHFEIATGRLAASEADGEPPSETHLNAALAAADGEQLAGLESGLAAAVTALKHIESTMRDGHGSEGAPEFDPLVAPLEQIRSMLAAQISARAAETAALAAPAGDAEGAPGSQAVIGVGSIRSRDDAARALEAVAAFFRKNEPSSPVPIVVERARRLIAKDFLEVLADMAPDGLDEAKRIGGIRDE